MYIFALVLILMLINWLFFSSYYSIYKILFFDTKENVTTLRRIILVNLSSFLYFGIIYFLIGCYFYIFPDFNGKITNYLLICFLIFLLMMIFSFILIFIEKIRYKHVFFIVLFSMIVISIICPILISISYEKYN
jgi:drug/metabolite transporter (DMT)-like permease